ncbi:hypothetical protein Pmar_PMAR016068, partial [Perkinsus marinus ATCC 50983]
SHAYASWAPPGCHPVLPLTTVPPKQFFSTLQLDGPFRLLSLYDSRQCRAGTRDSLRNTVQTVCYEFEIHVSTYCRKEIINRPA